MLGEGGYGRVVLARHVESGEPSAVKTLLSSSAHAAHAITREINAMRHAGAHPNIVALHGYFSQPGGASHSLVLELFAGGELFAQVEREGAMPEERARHYFSGIAAAVHHMHCRGVCHRDLKLENVLLGGPDLTTPKICDFGLAHVYERASDGSGGFANVPLSQWCGSRSYCPPEVMARLHYDGFRADLWSLAVALFAMVAGFFPVEEATQRDWRFGRLAMLQLRGDGSSSTTLTIFSFYSRACPLSPALIDLIDRMLNIQPPRRLPLPLTLSSPWVTDGPTAEVPPRAAVPPGPLDAASAAASADVDIDEVDGPMHRHVYRLASLAEEGAAGVGGGIGGDAPPRLRRQRACSQRVGADEDDG